MEDSNETTTEKKGGKTVVIILMSLFVFIFSVMPVLFMMYLAYKDYMKPKQETISQSTVTSDTSTVTSDTSTKSKQNLGFIPPTKEDLAFIPMGNPNTQTPQAFKAINKNKLQQSQRQRKRLEQIQASRKRMDQEISNY